jgi:hypothetical protein
MGEKTRHHFHKLKKFIILHENQTFRKILILSKMQRILHSEKK